MHCQYRIRISPFLFCITYPMTIGNCAIRGIKSLTTFVIECPFLFRSCRPCAVTIRCINLFQRFPCIIDPGIDMTGNWLQLVRGCVAGILEMLDLTSCIVEIGGLPGIRYPFGVEPNERSEGYLFFGTAEILIALLFFLRSFPCMGGIIPYVGSRHGFEGRGIGLFSGFTDTGSVGINGPDSGTRGIDYIVIDRDFREHGVHVEGQHRVQGTGRSCFGYIDVKKEEQYSDRPYMNKSFHVHRYACVCV